MVHGVAKKQTRLSMHPSERKSFQSSSVFIFFPPPVLLAFGASGGGDLGMLPAANDLG